MARLTQAIRESIRRAAIQAAFVEREQVHKDKEHALATECYEAMLPEAERLAAAAMPKHWLRMDACLQFNANGWSVRLCVKEAVPVPYGVHCSRVGTVTGELADRVQQFSQAGVELRNSRVSASNELDGFLEQFKTIKQLQESWPEGEQFYKRFDVERPVGGVPAVRVAEINKLLNLAEAA